MEDPCSPVEDSSLGALSEHFDDGLYIFEKITRSEEPETSLKLQSEIKSCIRLLEKCTISVNEYGIYKCNEIIDEVPIKNVKYLLLPALLGILVSKIRSPNRFQCLETSEIYLKDYLTRMQDYEVISQVKMAEFEEQHAQDVPPKKLTFEVLMKEREERIEKARERKENVEELKRLKKLLSTDEESDDAKFYYILYMKSLASVCLLTFRDVIREKPFAKHLMLARYCQTFLSESAKKELNKDIVLQPPQPIILTEKDMEMKAFGAAYPSEPSIRKNPWQGLSSTVFPHITFSDDVWIM